MIKNILIFFGVDKAIGYSVLARVIQALGGVISLFFIALTLNINEQGFYYTFGSIIAIQIFLNSALIL